MKKINLRHLLPTLITVVALLLCLCVWPLGFVGQASYESNSLEKGLILSAPISEGAIVQGSFTAAHETCNQIGIKFNTRQDVNITDGVLHFSFTDENGELLYEAQRNCTEIKNNDYEYFQIDKQLTVGSIYTYTLSTTGCTDGAPRLYLGSTGIGPIEQTDLRMNDLPLGKWAVLQLSYTDSLTFEKALVYDVCILLLAILILFATKFPVSPTAEQKTEAPFSLRGCCIFLCVLLIGTCLILLSDESRRPISTNGCDLKHDYGAASYHYLTINEDSGYSGAWASMDRYALNKGTYSIGLEYGTGSDNNRIVITDNLKVILDEVLPATETYMDYQFTLEKDSQEIDVKLHYGGSANLTAYSVTLNPVTRAYQDVFYYVVLLWLLSTIGVILYIRNKQKPVPQTTRNLFLLLLGIGIFSCLPYCHGSLPWGDDLCYHLVRIEGIKDGLLDGQLPVNVYPEGLNGYGYLNCMYPNLFLYIPAILRIFGISIAVSYKTLIFLFNIGTVFITYYCVKSIYPNKKAAVVAAALYCCCPYRYTNLYARGAVGEALAMTFFPLLLAGLYHTLLSNRKYWWLLTLAMTGLLQTHILSATLGGIICVIAGLIFFGQVIVEKRILPILKAAILTILVNLWFLIPFLYYYTKGSLWMSALGYSTYNEYVLYLSELMGTLNPDGYRTLTLGLPIVLCGGIALFGILTQKKNEQEQALDSYMKFTFVMGIICTILLLSQFDAWSFMELAPLDWFFTNLQFPWRLLGQISLFFAFSGCIYLFRNENTRKYADIIGITLCIVCFLSTTRYTVDNFAYETYTATHTVGHESKLIGIPKGPATIVYPYEWRRENLTNDLLVTDAVRVSDSESIMITDYDRDGTTTTLSYVASGNGTIEFPVQYYEGYVAKDENKNKTELFISDNQLVSFEAIGDGEEHTVTLRYTSTLLFKLSFLLSLFSGVIAVVVATPWGKKRIRGLLKQ